MTAVCRKPDGSPNPAALAGTRRSLPPPRRLLLVLFAVGLFFPSGMVSAQGAPGAFSIAAKPGVLVPLGEDAGVFSLGGGLGVTARYTLPFFPRLSLGAELSHVALGLEGIGTLLNVSSGGILARIGTLPSSRFGAALYADGGYFYGFLAKPEFISGSNPYYGVGLEASFKLTETVSLGLYAHFRTYLALCHEPSAGLFTSFTFPKSSPSRPAPQKAEPAPVPQPLSRPASPGTQASPDGAGALKIEKVDFTPVFPVFYKYYDTHPLGSVTIANTGTEAVDNLTISLFLKQYMDTPKTCATNLSLAPGEQRQVDLQALFTTKVLEISEETKSAAQILVDYSAGGKRLSTEYNESVRIHDRNAMTWDDDRKACAFVTAKDPTVMKFSKNVASITKDKGSRAVNQNLLSAMAIHEALRLFGLSYVVDPSSAYVESVANKDTVDYLQYPRQTLDFKAGDCDDLSILYASLLESVGVETAFVTVPGHIFMAVSLGIPPDAARKEFLRPDDLILTESTSWLPIEVTERQKGFIDAWQTGAKEWRENAARKQANIYPIHEAWKLYEPVGISGETAAIALPDADKLTGAYLTEVVRYVDQEIYPQVAKLQAIIASKKGEPGPVNRLGVLYARYGLSDRAEAQFKQALTGGEYGPALLNLGNVRYLEGDMQGALSFYNRAQRLTPDNAVAILAVARANHALENYGTAKTAYDKLKSTDPVLASRFAYLDLRGSESSRAADIAQVKDVVVWEE